MKVLDNYYNCFLCNNLVRQNGFCPCTPEGQRLLDMKVETQLWSEQIVLLHNDYNRIATSIDLSYEKNR